MKVSVIYLNYNSASLLRRSLRVFIENASDYEVIVVDNGEYRGAKRVSLEGILGENIVDNIKLLVNKENRGFGVACGQGTEIASGEMILFLNPDCFIEKSGVDLLVKTLTQEHHIGCIAPKLVDEKGVEQRWSYGKVPSIWDKIFSREKAVLDMPGRKDQKLEDTLWISGACLLIRKEMFVRMDGFDPKYFMYFEDQDLCRQIRKEGCRVVRHLGVFARHLESRSDISWKQRKRYYYASQSYFFKKHYGWLAVAIMWFIRAPLYAKNVFLQRQ